MNSRKSMLAFVLILSFQFGEKCQKEIYNIIVDLKENENIRYDGRYAS